MLFQLRTDNHIQNTENLTSYVQAEVESALHGRYQHQMRRIEVYLQDVNAQKGGIDKRCSVEAHLSGHQPVVVHHQAGNLDDLVSGAMEKLLHALEHTLGRLHDRHGHTSASGEET